jgi:predicted nucleic acid-binding protein
VDEPAPRRLRVFYDADVLIAGAASTEGASHVLLQLSELTLVDAVTSAHVIAEVERNLLRKLPAALPAFRLLVDAAVALVDEAQPELAKSIAEAADAHAKDAPILAAAISCRADFLCTFNTRHFCARRDPPRVVRPATMLARIRESLARLVTEAVPEQ